MNTKRSQALFDEACRVLVGGVNSPVRAFTAVGGTPRFITRGEGSRVYDADGNEYIDYVGSWGPIILGHAHPVIVGAIERASRAGTSFGAQTASEVELAELIAGAMPTIERVRFVNSGTEAALSALRLARAFTGRQKIVKCAGCYHGHADSLLVSAGSGALTRGVPDSPGVPAALASETIVVPYNDADAIAGAFQRFPNEIACVILEPIAGNMGLVMPRPGYLTRVRELTARFGALLISDEVITGFRVAYGGAQALFDFRADLVCLGKIIGGGLPVGAFGGRRDVMDRLAPTGDVYQAGTLSGNPLAMSAGIAQLRELAAPGVYDRLEETGAALEAGLRSAFADAGVAMQFGRVGSMWGLFFADAPVVDLASAKRSNTQAYATFFHAMLERGIYLVPSQFEVGFISLAHSKADIDHTVAASRAALQENTERSGRPWSTVRSVASP